MQKMQKLQSAKDARLANQGLRTIHFQSLQADGLTEQLEETYSTSKNLLRNDMSTNPGMGKGFRLTGTISH